MMKFLRDEPVWTQAAVQIIATLAATLGFHLTVDQLGALNLFVLLVGAIVTRRFTRAKANSIPVPSVIVGSHGPELITASTPRAAVIPAQPKEHEMDIQEFEDTAKARVAAVLAVADAAWAALPEGFRHDAIDALGKAVNGLADVAAAQVEKITPPSIDALIEEEKAKVKAAADARIAALDTLKPMVAA